MSVKRIGSIYTCVHNIFKKTILINHIVDIKFLSNGKTLESLQDLKHKDSNDVNNDPIDITGPVPIPSSLSNDYSNITKPRLIEMAVKKGKSKSVERVMYNDASVPSELVLDSLDYLNSINGKVRNIQTAIAILFQVGKRRLSISEHQNIVRSVYETLQHAYDNNHPLTSYSVGNLGYGLQSLRCISSDEKKLVAVLTKYLSDYKFTRVLRGQHIASLAFGMKNMELDSAEVQDYMRVLANLIQKIPQGRSYLDHKQLSMLMYGIQRFTLKTKAEQEFLIQTIYCFDNVPEVSRNYVSMDARAISSIFANLGSFSGGTDLEKELFAAILNRIKMKQGMIVLQDVDIADMCYGLKSMYFRSEEKNALINFIVSKVTSSLPYITEFSIIAIAKAVYGLRELDGDSADEQELFEALSACVRKSLSIDNSEIQFGNNSMKKSKTFDIYKTEMSQETLNSIFVGVRKLSCDTKKVAEVNLINALIDLIEIRLPSILIKRDSSLLNSADRYGIHMDSIMVGSLIQSLRYKHRKNDTVVRYFKCIVQILDQEEYYKSIVLTSSALTNIGIGLIGIKGEADVDKQLLEVLIKYLRFTNDYYKKNQFVVDGKAVSSLCFGIHNLVLNQSIVQEMYSVLADLISLPSSMTIQSILNNKNQNQNNSMSNVMMTETEISKSLTGFKRFKLKTEPENALYKAITSRITASDSIYFKPKSKDGVNNSSN